MFLYRVHVLHGLLVFGVAQLSVAGSVVAVVAVGRTLAVVAVVDIALGVVVEAGVVPFTHLIITSSSLKVQCSVIA